LEVFNLRHSGLDPESRISVWIPAFAGMTTLIYANIYTTFRFRQKGHIDGTIEEVSGGRICRQERARGWAIRHSRGTFEIPDRFNFPLRDLKILFPDWQLQGLIFFGFPYSVWGWPVISFGSIQIGSG
jgi:hypothetical protein